MKEIYKRIIGHFIITKNKVIRAEIKSINHFYLNKNNRKSVIKVLEIGPGERDLYGDRYNIDNISINLTMIDANFKLNKKPHVKKIVTKIFQGIVPAD